MTAHDDRKCESQVGVASAIPTDGRTDGLTEKCDPSGDESFPCVTRTRANDRISDEQHEINRRGLAAVRALVRRHIEPHAPEEAS